MSPAPEETISTWPLPLSRMAGSTARALLATPVRLTAIVFRKVTLPWASLVITPSPTLERVVRKASTCRRNRS